MRVLAKAYKDEPLDRLLVGENTRVYYVANPSTVSSTGQCTSEGVGFPKAYVFEFDAGLLESLDEAWRSGDAAALASLWRKATPFRGHAKIAA